MRSLSSAAGRARWLAEVARALDEAKATVETLDASAGAGRDYSALVGRIEAARQATRALRLRSERRIEREKAPQ